ncbi:hypothetical protein N9X05_10460 [Paracoccaceae bacterium]|nr:hypothetical protein [Paracoccaceae bacterium]
MAKSVQRDNLMGDANFCPPHNEATTAPTIQAIIQASDEPTWVLA